MTGWVWGFQSRGEKVTQKVEVSHGWAVARRAASSGLDTCGVCGGPVGTVVWIQAAIQVASKRQEKKGQVVVSWVTPLR